MNDLQGLSRRQLLGMAVAAGGLTLFGTSPCTFAQALKRTPGEILGPFTPFSERSKRVGISRCCPVSPDERKAR